MKKGKNHYEALYFDGKPLINEPGYYYCEPCITRFSKETHPVPAYHRKPNKEFIKPELQWPAGMDWIPLCDKHSKGYIPYKEKIVLTGTEPIFKEEDEIRD